jgi:hypothetical protein
MLKDQIYKSNSKMDRHIPDANHSYSQNNSISRSIMAGDRISSVDMGGGNKPLRVNYDQINPNNYGYNLPPSMYQSKDSK